MIESKTPSLGRNSRFNWRGLTSGPSTEKRSRCRKFITLCSRATITIYPTTVIAGNESGTATFHFAESVARTADFARAIVAITLWNSGDDRSDSEDDSEHSLHGGFVMFDV